MFNNILVGHTSEKLTNQTKFYFSFDIGIKAINRLQMQSSEVS